MEKLIRNLPMDIVLRIIPYTYQLQQRPLLDDIENFTKTKTRLLESYYQYWTIEIQEPEPDEYKWWLINDFFGYANGNQATMYGYIDKFYNIFLRNHFLQSDQAVNKYIKKLEKKDISTQINIFLGLFTVKERNDFHLVIE
jgi:hypothetical protein